MSSSRTAADPAAATVIPEAGGAVVEHVAPQQVLLDLLGKVTDPRARRGQRHSLAGVLAAGMAATLAGACSFAAMAQWATDTEPDLLARLGLRRCPSEATFRRAVTMVDPDELDRLLGSWFHTSTTRVNGRRVIAIDGKTVRGARTQDAAAPHLVAAFDHGSGTVLGQIAVAAKSNEIPAARDLLTILDQAQMLTGAVVTLDAMHTQTDTAEAITAAEADYVLAVKANQKSLYQACKRLPWKHIPTHSSVENGHGRRVHRAIKITTAPAWIHFTGASQVAKIRRTVTRPHPKTPAGRRRRSRSSTSSPQPTTGPRRPRLSQPGSRAIGVSKTGFTGSGT